jgi:amino acid adenylation domain-containing protein
MSNSNLKFFDEMFEKERSYWLQKLSGIPAATSLPSDFTKPEFGGEKSSVHFGVDSDTERQLREVCKDKESLAFALLVAALKICLYRYTGSEEIIVGTTIHERYKQTASINKALILRDQVRGTDTAKEVIFAVKQTLADAYAHQKYPFSKALDLLGISPSERDSQAFGIVVMLESINNKEHIRDLKHEIAITFSMNGEGLSGEVEYNPGLFRKETLESFCEHYKIMLRSILQAPETQVRKLALLSESERHRLLVGWNDTGRSYSEDLCIHELFEAQAERSPDALAVAFEGETLTFSELNRRANQLAHYLRSLGVKPDVPVALRLERSLDMAVATLGVLKAGGAYVPLDPMYPKQWIQHMIEDSQVQIILAHEDFSDEISEEGASTISLGAEWANIARFSDENPKSGARLDNLAYVIYTSGSTGKPKGIAMPHRPLVNLLEWHCDTLSRGTRTLQFAALSFDASFHEMFSAWLTGGALYIISNDLRLDTFKLGRFIRDNEIQKVTLPVTVLQQLAEEFSDEAESLRSIIEIISTGEQLIITTRIAELLKAMNWSSLHNHYGPSETHVVTSLTLRDDPDLWPTYPSIGRPIFNTGMYVADKDMNLMPVGVPGELYIGGDSLARGYINRPELSADGFIPDCFGPVPGARLYKTGDLARYSQDGDIEFLSRIDHQVKIRGFRIELGQIEAAVAEHSAVREVVAMQREDAPGDKRIIVYVAPAADADLRVNDLYNFLKDKLPEYMMPSAFVVLEQMPLTINGKVDRRALPAPDHERPDIEEHFIAPRTPAEEVVSSIWKDVLGINEIGVRDNFFRLGGHSMLAARSNFRLREAFRVDLPLRSLFISPTIEGVVNSIAELWGGREIVEEIATTLLEVENLSEDEVNMMLSQENFDAIGQ